MYHSVPVDMGAFHSRPMTVLDVPIPQRDVVNHPTGSDVIDLDKKGEPTAVDIDALLADFQAKHTCKVCYSDFTLGTPGPRLFAFDVFEPSWPDSIQARAVMEELSARLVGWVRGRPTTNQR